MKLFTFWRDMDDDDKRRLIWITGAAVAVFAVFTLLSCFSYLFTWRSDQSLRTLAVLDSAAAADNSAGSIGFRWADFLVRRCFGLGSFILVVILFAVAVRLLFGRWHHSMLKTLLVTVSGALLASLLLAYVSTASGLTNVFGGGLGGECGDTLVQGSIRCFGTFLTGLLLLLLLVGWLFLVSRRFSRWLTAFGRGDAGPAEEPVVEKRPGRRVKTGPIEDPETIPDPEPEPEPE
ncbi:MAG: DNA translocase FtsK 4TM domain-containing protein, partial [Bacteroidales bacterium]|nr:DNA translocase FtsK 4TM domain-containing protein [Bacteroidales bacterium]